MHMKSYKPYAAEKWGGLCRGQAALCNLPGGLLESQMAFLKHEVSLIVSQSVWLSVSQNEVSLIVFLVAQKWDPFGLVGFRSPVILYRNDSPSEVMEGCFWRYSLVLGALWPCRLCQCTSYRFLLCFKTGRFGAVLFPFPLRLVELKYAFSTLKCLLLKVKLLCSAYKLRRTGRNWSIGLSTWSPLFHTLPSELP